MLNVIVRDMAASPDFYQRLGIAIPGEAAGDHVQLKMPGGFSLELDTGESTRLWHAGWGADPASARVVLGFMLDPATMPTAPRGSGARGHIGDRHPALPMFCSALSSMPGQACCRPLKTLDPALGGRRQVQPGSPARLAQAGTRTSRLVSSREDTPAGTPGHAR